MSATAIVEGGLNKALTQQIIPARMLASGREVSLRTCTEADLPFLQRLYASTRALEMEQVDWTDAQKDEFLQFQFHAQHTHYNEHFAQASRDIIEVDGGACGRLYLDLRVDEIRLIDIALLPESCGQGVGGAILAAILEAGRARNLPVTIHVEQNNPALHLYQRLGFEQIDEQGIYFLMRWAAPSSEPTKEDQL